MMFAQNDIDDDWNIDFSSVNEAIKQLNQKTTKTKEAKEVLKIPSEMKK